jgi:hypothetical protein
MYTNPIAELILKTANKDDLQADKPILKGLYLHKLARWAILPFCKTAG